MKKLNVACLCLALIGILPGFLAAEQLTVTSQFPSPLGAYKEIRASGNAYLAINPGSKVGIGTTNPLVKMDIVDSGTVGLRYLRSGSRDARIQIGDPTKTWGLSVGWAAGGDLSIIEEGVAGDRLYIQQGGNVGIGTANPTNKFEVQGGNISLASPGSGIVLRSPSGSSCKLLSVTDAGATALVAWTQPPCASTPTPPPPTPTPTPTPSCFANGTGPCTSDSSCCNYDPSWTGARCDGSHVGCCFYTMGSPTDRCGACFTAGTRVLTPQGQRNIEEIAIGDIVYSVDDVTGGLAPARVKDTHRRNSRQLWHVSFTGGLALQVTPNHPIYDNRRKEYRPIGEFKVGDKVLWADVPHAQEMIPIGAPMTARFPLNNPALKAGGSVPWAGEGAALKELTLIGIKELPKGNYSVYNLTIDGPFHNYLAEGVLVHNKG